MTDMRKIKSVQRASARFVHREGFWHSKSEPLLPKPQARDKAWKGKRDFLKALSAVEASDEVQRQHYKGWSTCRICKAKNGSAEYKLTALGTTWVWPAGFAHYVSEHNVRPSLAFQEFIHAVVQES